MPSHLRAGVPPLCPPNLGQGVAPPNKKILLLLAPQTVFIIIRKAASTHLICLAIWNWLCRRRLKWDRERESWIVLASAASIFLKIISTMANYGYYWGREHLLFVFKERGGLVDRSCYYSADFRCPNRLTNWKFPSRGLHNLVIFCIFAKSP